MLWPGYGVLYIMSELSLLVGCNYVTIMIIVSGN